MTLTDAEYEELMKHFNSHPHEEDDFAGCCDKFTETDISTHILTKRMT